jgi:hypothetical protein
MGSLRRRNASSATLSPDTDRAAVVHQIVLNRLRWRLRHIKNCDVACWHETDMPKYLGDVRYWVNSGKHLLALTFSGFDPKQTFGSRK